MTRHLLLALLFLNITLSAQDRFNITDLDQDWMDDTWETANDLDPMDRSDAYDDNDGDGLSNVNEYYLNTDPHDANDPMSIRPTATNLTDIVEDNFETKTHILLQSGDYTLKASSLNLKNGNIIITGGWNADYTLQSVEVSTHLMSSETIIDLYYDGGANNIILNGLSLRSASTFNEKGVGINGEGDNYLGLSKCNFYGPAAAVDLTMAELSNSRLLMHHCIVDSTGYNGIALATADRSKIDARIYNCTVMNNYKGSFLFGDGLALIPFDSSTISAEVRNCVFWNNERDDIRMVEIGDGKVSATISNCVAERDPTGWEIDLDLDAATYYKTDPLLDNNFVPMPGSPCIDAGIDLGFSYNGDAPDIGSIETLGTASTSGILVEKAVIYPNPVLDGSFSLDVPDDSHVSVLSLSGNKIPVFRTGQSFQLSREAIAGTYIVRVVSKEGVGVGLFSLNR